MIRSQYGAARLAGSAPHDTIHFRVYHRATPTGSDAERLSGVIDADATAGPRPVVVILPGINVPPDSYGWLAVEIAEAGFLAVTMGAVGDLFGGHIGLTPGLDLAAVTPNTYGTAPTASGVQPVLSALAEYNEAGPLRGVIDLNQIVLLGHSAGGTIALQSADTRYFPGLIGSIAYGAHTMASTALGFSENTILPISDTVPTLLLAGEHDGVMAASKDRYGGGDDHDPVTRTFDEGLTRAKQDSYLVVLAGANHLSICHPHDPTTARGFLDATGQTDEAEVRATIAALTTTFLGSLTNQTSQEPSMPTVLDRPLIKRWRSR